MFSQHLNNTLSELEQPYTHTHTHTLLLDTVHFNERRVEYSETRALFQTTYAAVMMHLIFHLIYFILCHIFLSFSYAALGFGIWR